MLYEMQDYRKHFMTWLILLNEGIFACFIHYSAQEGSIICAPLEQLQTHLLFIDVGFQATQMLY